MKLNSANRAVMLAKGIHRAPMNLGNYLRVWTLRRRGARICNPVFIAAGALVSGDPKNLSIAAGSYLGPSEYYALASIRIGERVLVGSRCYLCTGTHDFNSPQFTLKTGDIVIEGDVWIATGVTIIGPSRIGRGAIIGAGAVVRGDVAPLCIVIGNPAKVIAYRKSAGEFEPMSLVGATSKYLIGAALRLDRYTRR
jgi:putative colanic acid biosynthesis acetyltransferase WcaF